MEMMNNAFEGADAFKKFLEKSTGDNQRRIAGLERGVMVKEVAYAGAPENRQQRRKRERAEAKAARKASVR